MKVYVISLVSELKRREQIINQFKRFKFDGYEFFDAIDVRSFNDQQIKNIFNINKFYDLYGRYPSNAEVGCTLSHVECLKKISTSCVKGALIVEDDAIFQKGFERILASDRLLDITILGYVKIKKNILFYHYIKEPIRKVFNITQKIYIGKSRREWRCGTVCYYASQDSANNILAHIDKTIIPCHLADDWGYISSLVNIYHSRPLLVLEDFVNMSSSIEHERGLLATKTGIYKIIIMRVVSFLNGIIGHVSNLFFNLK